MIKLSGIRRLSLFKRKAIVFVVIFVLAIPMSILIGSSLAGRVSQFDSTPLFKQFEINEELGESFLQVQETSDELKGHMASMPATSTSTLLEASTSDDILVATTTE